MEIKGKFWVIPSSVKVTFGLCSFKYFLALSLCSCVIYSFLINQFTVVLNADLEIPCAISAVSFEKNSRFSSLTGFSLTTFSLIGFSLTSFSNGFFSGIACVCSGNGCACGTRSVVIGSGKTIVCFLLPVFGDLYGFVFLVLGFCVLTFFISLTFIILVFCLAPPSIGTSKFFGIFLKFYIYIE